MTPKPNTPERTKDERALGEQFLGNTARLGWETLAHTPAANNLVKKMAQEIIQLRTKDEEPSGPYRVGTINGYECILDSKGEHVHVPLDKVCAMLNGLKPTKEKP